MIQSLLTSVLIGLTAFPGVSAWAAPVTPPAPKKDPTYLDAFKILDARMPLSAGAWRVKKAAWDAEDEKEYSEFVAAIGKGKCSTVDNCLKNPKINKYFDPVEKGVFYYADCGRFPYMLRMYFAWKKGLPFSAVTKRTGTPEDLKAWIQDERKRGVKKPNVDRDYPTDRSESGNLMSKRNSIPSNAQNAANFFEYGRSVIPRVNSSNFRFDAEAVMPETPDFYPVDINRGAIRPGTIVYDPQGHVAVVFDISESGQISLVESHPGNSVTRKLFNRTFRRSRPAHGAGFKNWRPLKIATPAHVAAGAPAPWKISFAKNEELKHFSKIQFYGNKPDPSGKWTKGLFLLDGRRVDFHEFLQFKLAGQGFKIEPVSAFRTSLNDICLSLRDRVADVQKAVDHGIPAEPHQVKMPQNIYSDEGTWENNSTPGRDIRLRQQYSELLGMAQNYFMRIKSNDPSLDYTSTPIRYREELFAAVGEYESSCAITYKNSRGTAVKVGFLELLKRFPAISFDPYHCPERRWGESDKGLSTCSETADKARWYTGQEYYRRAIEKDPSLSNDFTLDGQLNENRRRLPLAPQVNYDLREELLKLE